MRLRWIFGLWCVPWLAVAQPDARRTTVFNSVELEEVAYDGFSITSGYYTIADNINNRQSSAFISDSPSSDEYIYFARHQPSYYFLVHRQREVIRMIIFQQRVKQGKSRFSYTVIDPVTSYRNEVSSKLAGELTQLRAKELLMSHVDSLANLVEATSVFSFNQLQYSVQPFSEVRQEVVTLTRRLLDKNQSRREELEEYIRAETTGGTLDFAMALEKETQPYFQRNGSSYNKNDFSVLLWGGAVRILGLYSVEEARRLWEEIQQRPLTARESKALGKGFAQEDQSAFQSIGKPQRK